MQSLTCGRCGGAMEQGFMIEAAHGSALIPPEWAEGEIQRSFWTGVDLKGRRRLPVITYRCTSCGLLESYAW